MYAGVDKYGGSVVGNQSKSGDSLEEIIETASAEETLVVNVPIDEEGKTTVEVLLKAQLNPSGGGLMWLQEENTQATYNNVIAMSQMTSMLRDHDRNEKYKKAIKQTIESFKEKYQRPPKVLDIGTGTGLLSMLAANAGAEEVYACELFPKMAEVAHKVTKQNSKQHSSLSNIHVIPKRSNDLIVGQDIPEKLDVAVFEIFDSVLLGEAVLPSLRHAYQNLLKDQPMIVPSKATLYGQLVQNDSLFRCHSFHESYVMKGLKLARNDKAFQCHGGRIALPMHIEHCMEDSVHLSKPFEVFHFDFSQTFPEYATRSNQHMIQSIQEGQAQVLFLWWDLNLSEDVVYSTLPGAENWQDHWVQIVYPLGKSINVKKDSIIQLRAFHNDLNVWFECPKLLHEDTLSEPFLPPHQSNNEKLEKVDIPTDPCTCGMHILCNAERISMLNNSERNSHYVETIQTILNEFDQLNGIKKENVECLDISDGSLCALIAARCGSSFVTSIESKSFSSMMFQQIVDGNELNEKIRIMECGCKGLVVEHMMGEKPVQLLMGEPFYYSMQNLPLWQALNFWYRRTAVDDILASNVRIVPHCGVVKASLVEFEHLHECFGKAGIVESFDHDYLDQLQHEWYLHNFPFPLWMYPYKPLTEPVALMTMEYTKKVSGYRKEFHIPISAFGNAHALVVWIEYELDSSRNHIVSTRNAMHCKQLVRFLPEQQIVTPNMFVKCKIEFQADEGKFDFQYEVINH